MKEGEGVIDHLADAEPVSTTRAAKITTTIFDNLLLNTINKAGTTAAADQRAYARRAAVVAEALIE